VVALGQQKNLEHIYSAEMLEKALASIPIGRLGDPIEAGAFCAYLASDEAGGMTGQTIDFNGGSQTR
jgi:3-oxoacyl-[acyl-carrier protein] reductase